MISRNNIKKIYDPSFTTKKGSGGISLGLFMVKELTDRLGITLSIDSEPGKGTEFTLHFDDMYIQDTKIDQKKSVSVN